MLVMQDILNILSKIIPNPILLDELLVMSIIATIIAVIIVLNTKNLKSNLVF